MLEKELEIAIAAAREAGTEILKHYAAGVVAELKRGVDNFAEPVTIADRIASEMIVARLRSAFPEDGILSEEEHDAIDERTSRSRVWMIDPIDGTQGFINKDGDFGVQIGLSIDGRAVLGVVYLPNYDELYHAIAGKGAFLSANGTAPKQLTVSAETDFSVMTMAVSRNHLSPKMKLIGDRFAIRKVIHRGSVGLKIGLIARQTADLYIHLSPRTKFWDSCAPQAIIEESGGRITDLFGAPLRYDLHDVQNHNGIVASNGAAHDDVIDSLRPLLAEFGRLKVRNPR